ncbi:MAG: efflux RND transporter periplasmic adaptor subunit [Candidatus Omnitrophica bacterium]|nr:efflux RND transporter periplasmic adaptor subunit [Candidatus Omnitrophota bacterium]
MKRIKGYLGLFIFIGITSYLFGCQPHKPAQEKLTEEAIPVKVMRVQLKDIAEVLEYTGGIKAYDEVYIYPKVSGKIIEKVKQEGSSIEKEEAILYIDRDEVGFKFERAPVVSSLSGVIGRIYVDIGQQVNPTIPVALVLNMDKVKINLEIPERYLARLSLGLTAEVMVDAYPQEVFLGKITTISPLLDSLTRSIPVEITVDNPKHLLNSGMFAKVRLLLQVYKDVPVILKEAIMGKEPDFYVYTVENKRAVLRKVSLGIRQGPYYQVRQGLEKDSLVVIMGQQRLREGVLVSAEE